MVQANVSVLIIDDEPLLRRSIRDFLLDEDRFEVFTAGDGETGLTMLAGRMVDVCLVDLRLPGINGLEFIARAQELNPNLRFLIHTGSPEEQLPKSVIDNIPGLRGVLYKPLPDMGEIVRALDEAML